MVEINLDDARSSCDTHLETPYETAERIHSYRSYWHKWELAKVQVDQPEVYKEVLAEYIRLEQVKKSALGQAR